MHSFTQKMNKLSTSPVRGKSKPRSGTGGAPRRGWAFNKKHNVPSMVRDVTKEYLAAV
jgi:hypothetical protein